MLEQTKFKVSEVWNNKNFRMCENSYRQTKAYRMRVDDPHSRQDYVWQCPHCKRPVYRAFDSVSPYVAWLDRCPKCSDYCFIKKTNEKVPLKNG